MGRELQWLMAYVVQCLQDIWDVRRVHIDDDGDVPFRSGTAACWVSVIDADPLFVRVWAYAVTGIKPTAPVLRELNEINRRSRTATAYWADAAVVVEQTLHADGVDRTTLLHACEAVSTVANGLGVMAAVYGGATPFPVEDDPVDHRKAG